MKEYENIDLTVEEKAYGEICQALHQNIKSKIGGYI